MDDGELHRGDFVGWIARSRFPGRRRAGAALAAPALFLCLILPGLILPGAAVAADAPGAGVLASGMALLALAVLAGLALLIALVQYRRATERQQALDETLAALASARAEAMAQAVTDPLTALPNRRALMDAYEARQQPLAERDLVLSLLVVDVDGFGRINAIAGAEAADRLLQRLACILSASVRRTDVVGRIGRDRFLLILMSLRYGGVAGEIAERLFARLADDSARHERTPALSVSIGSVDIGRPGTDFATALRKAELALAHGRTKGRCRAEGHRPPLDREDERRRRFAADLGTPGTQAIVAFYRPRVGRERQIVGLRALPHWRQQDGSLQPVDPVALAAELDLSATLSDRLLEAVVRDAAALDADTPDGARFIVPLAFERLIEAEYPERLLDRLLEAGLSPRRFEIVPCGACHPQLLERLARPLEALSNAGLSTTLDIECGLPVTELRRLPLDGLSLGARLIREIVVETAARATAGALVQLAHAQGCIAVAEGTDTPAIEKMVCEMGCDFIEGDRFARPLPAAGLSELLKDGIVAA